MTDTLVLAATPVEKAREEVVAKRENILIEVGSCLSGLGSDQSKKGRPSDKREREIMQ